MPGQRELCHSCPPLEPCSVRYNTTIARRRLTVAFVAITLAYTRGSTCIGFARSQRKWHCVAYISGVRSNEVDLYQSSPMQ
jgi:hypothetical protein